VAAAVYSASFLLMGFSFRGQSTSTLPAPRRPGGRGDQRAGAGAAGVLRKRDRPRLAYGRRDRAGVRERLPESGYLCSGWPSTNIHPGAPLDGRVVSLPPPLEPGSANGGRLSSAPIRKTPRRAPQRAARVAACPASRCSSRSLLIRPLQPGLTPTMTGFEERKACTFGVLLVHRAGRDAADRPVDCTTGSSFARHDTRSTSCSTANRVDHRGTECGLARRDDRRDPAHHPRSCSGTRGHDRHDPVSSRSVFAVVWYLIPAAPARSDPGRGTGVPGLTRALSARGVGGSAR